MLRQRPFLVEVLTAAALIAAPFVLPYLGFTPTTINRILVWGVFGLGFDILFGFTGLLSFGQSAFFGTGGMVAAYLLTVVNFPYVMPSLLAGTIVAAVIGYLVGLIALRRTGIYFAMITVAIAEVFYFVEFNPLSAYTGGENGLPGVPSPTLYLGFTTIHFNTDWTLYTFLAFWYFVGTVIALRIVRSPVGAVLRAIRDNPLRAAAVGHNIHGYKLTAFVIAAAYAGFAGGLLGLMQGFMPPDAFMFDTSGQLVMQTAIGGAGTLFGPLVGATVWLYLHDFLQTTLNLGASWKLVLGVVFVLLVCFLRRGLIGGIEDLYNLLRTEARKRPSRRPTRPLAASPPRNSRKPRKPTLRASRRSLPCRRVIAKPTARSGPILQASGLTKRYGGLVANSDIDFTVNHGEAARHHRPERRRQDHVLQDADLRGAADLRDDRVRGPRHHRHERDRRLSARPDQELPDQPVVQSADRARKPDHRCARRIARQVQARSVQRPDRIPGLTEQVEHTLAARQPRRARRHAGVGARLWRKAAAGNRPRAGDAPEPAAARRAARRHEPARARRNGRAAQVDRPGPHHDHHRSRHGFAVRAGRARHGTARGPRAGRRHAGRNQGQRESAGSLSRRRARRVGGE